MLKPVFCLALAATLSFTCHAGGFSPPPGEIERARAIIEFLASPQQDGREPGTPGADRAAAYLEASLRALNMGPLFDRGPRGRYRQSLEFGGEPDALGGSLVLHLPDGDVRLEDDQFRVVPLGATGTIERAPVTFVGYSIVAGPGGYLGYPAVFNMEGRVALALRYEPMDDLGRSLWSDSGWTASSGIAAKAIAADRRGAAAVVLVAPPAAVGNDDDLRRAVSLDVDDAIARGPLVTADPAAIRPLVAAGDPAGRELDELIELAEAGTVISAFEGVSLSVSAEVRRDPQPTFNIGAVLPGRGPLADEFVILAANYDGLGMGGEGSRAPEAGRALHPGADENASGVAAALLATERLLRRYDGLAFGDAARSAAVVFFTAGEHERLGSAAFLASPPVPPGDVHLIVGLDAVGTLGANGGRLTALYADSSPRLAEMVRAAGETAGVAIEANASGALEPLDHDRFDRAGIAGVVLTTGQTPRRKTPDDTPDAVDAAGVAWAAAAVAELTWSAATDPAPLPYTGPHARPDDEAVGGIRVRVGFAPAADAGFDDGVRIARVFGDTSAEAAGVRAGDRVVRWDGQAVRTVEQWAGLLAGHEPGDRVEVVVIRGEQELRLTMTLRGLERDDGR